ncbi:hypothetical protein [Parapedobacter lycopersici]|uniref:hypothetical protein n=1 Tax=Parapedobacter lycopersici TaxID=1864939 RepID=UPI0033429952
MNKDKKTRPADDQKEKAEKIKKREERLDKEIEQSFPASDPPSYSQPGNDKKDQ